jgi:hypothetical protein
MGNHIRQTQQPGALSFRKKAANKPAKGGFGVEYALYMMDLSEVYNIGNTDKSALAEQRFRTIQTLTPKAPDPIRPRFPRRT